MAKHVVATIDEIPTGGRKIVDVAGVSIGIFNLSGEYFALRNRCPHQGGPLCEGKLWGSLEASVPGEFKYGRPGEILGCLWHGWEFDIRTGQSWTDPRRLRTRRYAVSVEAGSTIVADEPELGDAPVKGPYVAQTFPVSTEGTYLVVDVPDESG
jgi:3-phenylpropionate/trans-cinnamate dioxygenase ferredoxin subunit